MLRKVLTGIAAGAAAGAAGTTALNAVTYADMALRGRPSSETPSRAVEQIAGKAGLTVPGDESHRQNRLSSLGGLTGLATGITVGAAYGAARSLGWRPPLTVGALVAAGAAMAGSDTPLTALGVTDPRTWNAADWASDALPHLAYGAVTAATYQATNGR